MSDVVVEKEWRFDSPLTLRQWHPGAEVADIRFEGGAMHFRTVGNDPIVEYLPLLDIPALPHQAVEIRLKTSTDGVAELFWSNTTHSPYGGFSPEKRTELYVRGDNQWHTYRLFPMWQKEGRIVRLRFDPHGFAEYALQFIRIVRLERAALVEERAFDFRNSASGWSAWHGVTLDTSPKGLRLRLAAPDGFAACLVQVPAERFHVLAVRLRSVRARHCTLVFGTSQAYGIQQHQFEVIPDGQLHHYNIDMLDAPAWNGQVVMLGIRPGEQVGDEVVMESLQLAREPQGPPDLKVLYFGIEDALPRAGVAVNVTLCVTNVGGQPVKEVKAQLSLPRGVQLFKTLPPPEPNLVFGQEAQWRWQAIFPRPLRGAMHATVRGANVPILKVRATVEVSARLSRRKFSEVPPPSPVFPKYPVGVYYFPGWRSAGQWAPITRFPERKPVLGWYREGDPQIADWHIKWAVEHGISFFVYDWYWVQGARQLEHALHQGYINSRYRKHLKFCLLWANHNPPGTSSFEDCIAVTRHWIEHYFTRAEHLRIQNRPVVIIFSPHRLREDMGEEGVRRALDAMRQECIRFSQKELYILACVGSTGEAVACAREGYDAVTAYNWPHLGAPSGTKWAPFESLIDGYQKQWESIVQYSPQPLLVPICGGWDSRPWHGKNALVRYGRTPHNFKRHLQDALRFVEANRAKVLPMVLIEAWNEWGEGSYIEPHREFGFGYLDAIREVFTTAPKQHTDLTPADIALPAPQVQLVQIAKPRWEFSTDALGWDNGMNITGARIQNGALTAETTSGDAAFFGPPVQIDSARYRQVRLRMRLQAGVERFEDMAQLFWSTRTSAESEANSERFTVRVDGNWHEYVVPIGENPRWRGVVTRLRFDPCTRRDVTVQLRLIELLP